MHVYGIKNCSTVKKALSWLDERNIQYTFHDFKKEGVSEPKLKEWENVFGWERLLNKRGTTWRKVSPEIQITIVDGPSARKLLMENTSMIKRPVVESSRGMLLGFDEDEYAALLPK